ncbi:hypothetical protein HJC23_002813 [Cyclotella cryptica]|uniref:Uncharacterized protein n=1 Tax=Cyclotella cryptica TaxID=29204 RepID=A0ABD3PN66_9STRA|eukprot:CCRYP_013083-RA/>CCRYP_013083-RA protein AED:0.03 eAED:0.03 QI:0/-1/0/1/-1/1/1/0/1391
MAMHYRRHPPANNAVNPFTGRGLPAASPYRSAADNDGSGKSHSSINMMAKKATLIILSFFMFFYIIRSSGDDVAVQNNYKQPPVKLKLSEVPASDTIVGDGGNEYDSKQWEGIKQAGDEPDEYSYKEEDKMAFFDGDGSPDAKDSTDGIDNNPYDYEDRREDADLYDNGENASRDSDREYKRPTVSSVDRDALSEVEYKPDSVVVGSDSQDFGVEKSDVEENVDATLQREKSATGNYGNDGEQDGEHSELDRKNEDSESIVKLDAAKTFNTKNGVSDLVYKSADENESPEQLKDYRKRQEDEEVSLRSKYEPEPKYIKRSDQDESSGKLDEYAKKDYGDEEFSSSEKLKDDENPDGVDSSETLSVTSKRRKDDDTSLSSVKHESDLTHGESSSGLGEADKYADPNSKFHDKDRHDAKVKEYSMHANESSNGGNDLDSKKDDALLVGPLDESEVSSDVIETKTLEVPISHSKFESDNKTYDDSKQRQGEVDSDRSVDENEAFKEANSNFEKSRVSGEAVSDRYEPESVMKGDQHDTFDSSEKLSEHSTQRPEDVGEARVGNSDDGLKWKNLDSKYRTSDTSLTDSEEAIAGKSSQTTNVTDNKTIKFTSDHEQSNLRESTRDSDTVEESLKIATSREEREGSDDHESQAVKEHSKHDASDKISEYSQQRREDSDKDPSVSDGADSLSSKKYNSIKPDRDVQAGSDNYKTDSFQDSHVSSKYDEPDADDNPSRHSKQVNEDSTGTKTESKNAKSTENDKEPSVREDERTTKVGSDEETTEHVAKSDKYNRSDNQPTDESEGKENVYRPKFSDVDTRANASAKNEAMREKVSDEGIISDVKETRLVSKKFPEDHEQNSVPSNQFQEDTDEDHALVAGKDVLGSPASESENSKLRENGAVAMDSQNAAITEKSDHIRRPSTRDGDEDEELTRVQSIETNEDSSARVIPQKSAEVEADEESTTPIKEDKASVSSRGAETEEDGSSSRAEDYVSSKSVKSIGNTTNHEASRVDNAVGKDESKSVYRYESVVAKSDRSDVHENANATHPELDEDQHSLETRPSGSVRGAVSKNDHSLKFSSEEKNAGSSASSSSLRGSKKKSIASQDEHAKEGSDVTTSEYVAKSDKYTSSAKQLEDESKQKEKVILSRSDEVDKGDLGNAKNDTVDEKNADGVKSKDENTDLTSKKYPKDDEKNSGKLIQLRHTDANQTVVGDKDVFSSQETDPESSKPREIGESATDSHDTKVSQKSDRVDSHSTRDRDEDEESTRVQSIKANKGASSGDIPQKNAEVESNEESNVPVNNDEATRPSRVGETEKNGSSAKAEDYVFSKSDKSMGNTTNPEASHVDDPQGKSESKSVNSEEAPASVSSNKAGTLFDSTELQSEKEANLLKVNGGETS